MTSLRRLAKIAAALVLAFFVLVAAVWLLGVAIRLFVAVDPLGSRALSADVRATIEALDAAHPFAEPTDADGFDAERFVTSLSIRSVHVGPRDAAGAPDDEVSLASIRRDLREHHHVLVLAPHLESAGMGWREFRWHGRVLWAALLRVDADAHPELASFAGTERVENPFLRERIRRAAAVVPSDVADAALAVLRRHPDLAVRAVRIRGTSAVPDLRLDWFADPDPER